jgi:hypothetical protein
VSPAWETVIISGLVVLLLNLLLTLRIVRWLQSFEAMRRFELARGDLPELPLGGPAPAFRARDLSGRLVRSEEFRGHETALVFVSPQCGPCRRRMPGIVSLAAAARRAAGARIVLVSDGGAGETQSWVTEIRDADKVDITIPVLIGSDKTSDLQARYNPRARTPYFCHIDSAGNVAARGGLHTPEWDAIVRRWDTAVGPARNSRRYM